MITVYVLSSQQSRRRYVGITNNLPRRLVEHHTQSTYVRRLLGTFDILLTEQHSDHASARVRERFLKSGQGREWLDSLQRPGTGSATGG